VRFLIVNTDYPAFLADLYGSRPELAQAPYGEQLQARYDSLFSVADFYSHNLRAAGHDAMDVYVNNEPMQRAWASEHGIALPPPTRHAWRLRKGLVPWRFRVSDDRWVEVAVSAQIEQFRPDVVVNQDVHGIGDAVIGSARAVARLVVAQLAATHPPPNRDWSLYDLAISSFPATIERFRALGLRAEMHRLGFDPRVLATVPSRARQIGASFVGSFHPAHASRTGWLEKVLSRVPVDVWTSGGGALGPASPIRSAIRGSALGRAMYEVLASSRVALNHHGDVGPYANNLRLFEATGMGALLITDWKPNLGDYFDVGREVVAYHSADECAELVDHYVAHEDERAQIAAAGQSRTLAEHTWPLRMQDLVSIVEEHLG
jgi:hypothetical protein